MARAPRAPPTPPRGVEPAAAWPVQCEAGRIPEFPRGGAGRARGAGQAPGGGRSRNSYAVALRHAFQCSSGPPSATNQRRAIPPALIASPHHKQPSPPLPLFSQATKALVEHCTIEGLQRAASQDRPRRAHMLPTAAGNRAQPRLHVVLGTHHALPHPCEHLLSRS